MLFLSVPLQCTCLKLYEICYFFVSDYETLLEIARQGFYDLKNSKTCYKKLLQINTYSFWKLNFKSLKKIGIKFKS